MLTALFVALGASGVSVREATEILDTISEIEHDLGERVTDIRSFAARFDSLMKYNRKMRAKVDYLRNKHNIQQSHIQRGELSRIQPQSLPIGNALTSMFGAVVGKKKGFTTEIAESSLATHIEVKNTPNDPCLVDEFEVHFEASSGRHPMKAGPFRLLPNTSSQLFSMPYPVLFNSATIIPSSNHGNTTHHCLPEVVFYGDGEL